MERFADRHRLWLRSRAAGAYLRADEDGTSVSLRPSRDSLSAVWMVHLLPRGGYDLLLLHNAAYGRYLAATGRPDSRGHRVEVLNYEDLNDFDLRWIAVAPTQDTEAVLLHHQYSRGNLSIGRKRWPKNSAVRLHVQRCDHQSRPSPQMLWVVEDVPSDLELPPQDRQQIPRNLSGPIFRSVRIIMQNSDDHRVILFMGNSLENLKRKIECLVGSGYAAYIRSGVLGRLTPLQVNLPTSTESVDLVLVPSETETDNVKAAAFTPLGEIEWGGFGLSVGCGLKKKKKPNSVAARQVWLVSNAEEAQSSIHQWLWSGKPEDAVVTVAANLPFTDMRRILRSFRTAKASVLLEASHWLREYRVLASISQLPHPPKEVESRFSAGIHGPVVDNNNVLEPWIIVDI